MKSGCPGMNCFRSRGVVICNSSRAATKYSWVYISYSISVRAEICVRCVFWKGPSSYSANWRTVEDHQVVGNRHFACCQGYWSCHCSYLDTILCQYILSKIQRNSLEKSQSWRVLSKLEGEQELTRSVGCWLEKFAMSISLKSLGLSLAILMKHAKQTLSNLVFVLFTVPSRN